LQREALARFGSLPKLQALRLDGCAQTYLVGNGQQPGRRGYCQDSLIGAGLTLANGPKLVVVPGVDSQRAFAMSKEEISVTLFNEFCSSADACQPQTQASSLPMANISWDLAQAFAQWLSELAGYTYRIPTASEWLQAVGSTPDPNRNCRVQLAGVERGLAPLAVDAGQAGQFGLVHGLGNVREWVLTGSGPQAAGGSYRDPLDQCVTSALAIVDLAGDTLTGLRLVREIP